MKCQKSLLLEKTKCPRYVGSSQKLRLKDLIIQIQGTNILASDGAIGQHFNPDGAVGQIGEKVGGPLSKDGLIGSQFDASKQGVAGLVEKAVGGPKNDIKK